MLVMVLPGLRALCTVGTVGLGLSSASRKLNDRWGGFGLKSRGAEILAADGAGDHP